MIRISNQSILKIYLILLWIGSMVYSIIYYLGLYEKGEELAKMVHLGLNGLMLVVAVFYFVRSKQFLVPRSYILLLFFLLIFSMGLTSITKLNIIDVVPSFLRFTNYLVVFVFAYQFGKNEGIAKCLEVYNLFLKLSIGSILLFGFAEIALGDIQFLNGAFRLSGSFKFHQLANGMYLFVVLISILFLKLNFKKMPNKSTIYLIIFFLILYLFFKVHSRILILSLFACLFIVYYFKLNRLYKRMRLFLIALLGSVFAVFLIFNTNIQPRLKEAFMFFNTKKVDASSKTRFEIISNTLDNLEKIEFFSGIGLGGFNNFYNTATGKNGVAAHNNFLLFLTEGGIFTLIIFLLFLFIISMKLLLMLKSTRKMVYDEKVKVILVASSLFIGIEVLGFLLNNYYFYQSEVIVWLFLGFAFTYSTSNLNNIETTNR